MKKATKSTTLDAVMDKLEQGRYDNNLILTPHGLQAPNGKYYLPEDLKIIKTYFFSDDNPENASVLYVIEADDGLIGYSMNTHGIFGPINEDQYEAFIGKIPIEWKSDKELFH